jgi:hypothetical protein
MGISLLVLAIGFGAGLTALLTAFPLPILAALLATAGLLHIGLLRDLREPWAWALALAVGLAGYQVHLAVALGGGLVVYWGARLVGALASVRLRTA